MSIGGTKLASSLAEAGLIDEFRLYFAPTVLGDGVQVFQQLHKRIDLTLVEVHKFSADVVLPRYRRKC